MSGCIESIKDASCLQRVVGGCAAAQLVIGIALIIICGIGASMHWGIPAIAGTGAVGGVFAIFAIITLIVTYKRPSTGSIGEGAHTTTRSIISISESTRENWSIISDKKAPRSALPAPRTLPEASLQELEYWALQICPETIANRKRAAARIIKCYEEKSTSLDLSNLALTSLPPTINVLMSLETLNLSGNALSSLPAMDSLISLRFLDLSRNQLSMLSKEIRALDKLRSLNLAQNKILVVPESIGQMSNLRTLDLSNNLISGIDPKTVGQMNRLSEILTINLNGNALDDITKARLNAPGPYDPYGPSFLFEGAMKNNEKEKEAAPADSDEKGKGVAGKREVPPSAPVNLDGLENWVKEAPEGEEGFRKMVAQQMRECFKSKSTELKLGSYSLTSLPPEIGTLSHLEYLNLSNNRLKSLPSEMGNLSRLQELDLSENDLTEFPEALCYLHDLDKLNMVSNKIVSLPPQIGRISNLRRLLLEGNQIASVSDETLHQIERLSPNLIIFSDPNPVWHSYKEGTKLAEFCVRNVTPSFNVPSTFNINIAHDAGGSDEPDFSGKRG